MDESISGNYFTWIDYSLFVLMLAISALIGVYFGFFGKKQDTPEEYIHGGKKMKIFPIASSLAASDVSGITLLGVPADIYMNGSAYSLCAFSAVISNLACIYLFVPVFYKLQVTSSFEYLKLRFSQRSCTIASAIFTTEIICIMPIMVYTSVLAFSQVSGVSMNITIVVVCMVCIFYTTFGGIKAVVWTDTVQIFVIVGSLLVVFALGVLAEGGFINIWEKAEKGGRIDFNLSFDPTNRQAGMSIILGLTLMWSSYGCNPMVVQRCISLPTYRDCQITLYIVTVALIFFKTFTSFMGLVIYAKYANCDPLLTGIIEKVDQLLPHYVIEVGHAIPGLPGLFIAGLFCAALSSLSSGLNTMSATIYEDFIKHRMPKNTTDKRASDVMKIIVVIMGILIMGLVFVIQHLGAILQLTYILRGAVTGPITAMFSLGMLIPMINEKGIICGSIGSILIMVWIIAGSQYYKLIGVLRTITLPQSTSECLFNVTKVYSPPGVVEAIYQPFYLYRLSFYYYTIISCLATVVIALLVSWFTGGRDQTVDKNLLSPLIYNIISKKSQRDKDAKCEKELEVLNRKLENGC